MQNFFKIIRELGKEGEREGVSEQARGNCYLWFTAHMVETASQGWAKQQLGPGSSAWVSSVEGSNSATWSITTPHLVCISRKLESGT